MDSILLPFEAEYWYPGYKFWAVDWVIVVLALILPNRAWAGLGV
ncbi:MAG: hypothetical protein ACE5E7_01495 [Anaerolineae bacterium]